MALTSEKFKFLAQAEIFLPKGTVPTYEQFSGESKIFTENTSWILRSSLRHESTKNKLQSGKSLSVGLIDSTQKLKTAWESIRGQSDFAEAILQEEIHWEEHYTVIYERDFFFAEIKNRHGGARFVYWTPLTNVQSPEISKLRALFEKLSKLFSSSESWLLELGTKHDQAYLFQIHPVASSLVSELFSNDLAASMVSSRIRFSRSGTLFSLLKNEWRAHQFRKSFGKQKFHSSQIFLNWEYIFHYFRLHCMIHQLSPNSASFAQFLSGSFKNNWIANLIKTHLKIANSLREHEKFDPLSIGFSDSGMQFLGKGKYQGILGEEIVYREKLDLGEIYGATPPRVILTGEIGLLSHPVLASIENGIHLVLGVERELARGERIYLDFDQKLLKVE